MVEETEGSRCLYIIGAQCTGKTTLVNSLEDEFCRSKVNPGTEGFLSKPAIIREVARTVLREKQFTRHDIVTSPSRAFQLQQYILEAQLAAEKAAVSNDTPMTWYISDRSGLDPIIYAQLFVGEKAAGEMLASETWKQLERRMKAGVVMLCQAGCTWLTDDGTRLMPEDMEQWMRIDSAFRKQLATHGIRYTVVPKDMVSLEERVQLVRDQLGSW